MPLRERARGGGAHGGGGTRLAVVGARRARGALIIALVARVAVVLLEDDVEDDVEKRGLALVLEDERKPSLLDIILHVIFEQYDGDPRNEGDDQGATRAAGADDGESRAAAAVRAAAAGSFTERHYAIHMRKLELRRMWGSTFGNRLPAASELVLKHAPSGVAPAVASRTLPGKDVTVGRPKMKCPGPMLLPGRARPGGSSASSDGAPPPMSAERAAERARLDELRAQLARSLM